MKTDFEKDLDDIKKSLNDLYNKMSTHEGEETINLILNMIKTSFQKCSICGEIFAGYGNNAQPVNNGTCCDECNFKYVIPARISHSTDNRKEITDD